MEASGRSACTVLAVCLLLATPGLAGCLGDTVSQERDPGEATVRWTRYGIPHVEADDWSGLGHGYGYAAARDYLCLIAEEYVTVAGERSQHFGPDGSYSLTSNGQTYTNLESDLFFTLLGEHPDLVDSAAEHPDPRLQDLLDGYVDGYNRYLQETSEDERPAECRGEEWVREIDREDAVRRMDKIMLIASMGFFAPYMVAAQPPGPGQAEAASPLVAPSALPDEQVRRDRARLPTAETLGMGSNGYAFGSEMTPGGSGMLMGNPHFSWDGPERFHQLHLTIPGELDVMGMTLLGVPLVLIGFNDAVAWTHTVSTGWRFSLHELQLAPGDPTSYVVDGETEEMQTREVSIDTGDGETLNHTFYFSRYGPIIDLPLADAGALGPGAAEAQAGLTWEEARAFALNDANTGNDRASKQFLEWNTADSFDEFVDALHEVHGIPWVNTIAASPEGEAFYADVSIVPNYDEARIRECNTETGRALFQAARIPVLDGSRSECAPIEDPEAVQPGTIPADEMPSIRASDWLMNSNDDYWLPHPEHRLEDHSPMIGWGEDCPPEQCARSTRTRMGLQMWLEREAGGEFACEIDPDVPCEEITLDRLQHSLFANRLYVPEHEMDRILDGACTPPAATTSEGQPVDLSEACEVLADWDRRADVASAGLPLFELFWLETPKNWAVPFDAEDPVHTPRGFVAEDARVRTALADAVTMLETADVPLDATAGEARFVEREGERIPVHGAHGSLGSPSMLVAPFEEGEGFAEPVHGNSYIQTVTWTEEGDPVAEAVLSYSQSPHEDSPHHADQTRLYADHEWVRLPFTEDRIQQTLLEERHLER